ncbi:MAG: PASTA domain-containing protein [Ruminococcaceae bacterium]|nr:PASTA domain-containing protein [Oscillospiraceae bacterium]
MAKIKRGARGNMASVNKIKKRIIIMFSCAIFLFVVLVVRIGYLTIVKGDEYKKQAIEQQTRDRLITPKRGTIYDRNGKPLAVSASVETVSISPPTVRKAENRDEIAETLALILEIDKEEVNKKIDKKTSYEIIKKKVEKDVADKIREKDFSGVYLDEDTKRYYPNGNFASHLIGFTGVDNQGLWGIEMICDSVLKGKSGRIVTAKSADGNEMPYKYERYYNPEDGVNVVLTIDQTMQHFLEKHLETAVIDNKIQNGAAGIIMDIKTGEILAMATKPDFDLNNPFTLNSETVKSELLTITDGETRRKKESEALSAMWRNKAVVDSYEPGSTFKIVVSAMGLETGKVSLNDSFNCNGYRQVGGYRIHCWKREGHGAENFVEGIKNSCNPVFMDIGERVGHEDFYKFYKAFGFTETTGIELNGETNGIFFTPENFNTTELATSSFGQGFQITPLQMITAVSAVANKGKLLRPFVVKKYVDDEGNVIEEFKTEVVRQVISEETSKLLCQVLENVVVDGGGKSAFIQGYHIAGKTGTSEKQPRGNGKYIASFVGFAPANDPQIACLVILDEPGGDQYMGSMVAAPVVKSIMEDTLRYLGVEPDLTEEEMIKEYTVPSVVGKNIEEARAILNSTSLKYKVEGSQNVVVRQVPEAGVVVAESATVILYTEETPNDTTKVVPDVLGLTYNEAYKKIIEAGFNISSHTLSEEEKTTLKVISQSPEAGKFFEQGNIITIKFKEE